MCHPRCCILYINRDWESTTNDWTYLSSSAKSRDTRNSRFSTTVQQESRQSYCTEHRRIFKIEHQRLGPLILLPITQAGFQQDPEPSASKLQHLLHQKPCLTQPTPPPACKPSSSAAPASPSTPSPPTPRTYPKPCSPSPTGPCSGIL